MFVSLLKEGGKSCEEIDLNNADNIIYVQDNILIFNEDLGSNVSMDTFNKDIGRFTEFQKY